MVWLAYLLGKDSHMEKWYACTMSEWLSIVILKLLCNALDYWLFYLYVKDNYIGANSSVFYEWEIPNSHQNIFIAKTQSLFADLNH